MNTISSFRGFRGFKYSGIFFSPLFTLSFILFASFSSLAQTQIICADGIYNDTYCYDNDESTPLIFQGDTGFPLVLTFNSGTVEDTFDELIVLDSDGVTNLNLDNEYGNSGDISGLTFTSSGDTITFYVQGDVSSSCQTGDQTIIDFSIECLDCFAPTASYEPVIDCSISSDFTVNIDVTDLSTATSVTVSDNQGSPTQTITEAGLLTFGPYPESTPVVFTVINDNSPFCINQSDTITALCPGGCSLLDAGEDIILDCNEPCATLNAEVIAVPRVTTSSYIIQGPLCDIPPVTGGTPTGLTADDTWTSVIDIEFTFNYFENDYTQLVVGANGQISFNTSLAGQPNGWQMDPTDLIPSTATNFPQNTIYGAYHDMDPSVTQNSEQINYFITGDAPYRIFVLNFDNVPHFGGTCEGQFFTTQQILLYESLNVIDVNLVNKPFCTDWNDGLAAVGLQGNDITQFNVPPDRNTGVWETTNENWRFVPNGEIVGASNFQWQDPTGTVIGNDPTITVCPTEDTVYTAVLTLENPDGTTQILTDDVLVDFNVSYSIDVGEDLLLCDISSYPLSVDITGINPNDASILWSTGETTQNISVTTTDTYTVEVTFNDCTLTETVQIEFQESPDFNLGPDVSTCLDEIIILDATPTNYAASEVIFEWSLNGNVLTDETSATLMVNQIGTYTVVSSFADCSSQDSVIISPSNDIAIEIGDDFETCFDEEVTLDASPSNYDPASANYQWSLNGELLLDETTPTLMVSQIGTYNVIVTIGICTTQDTITISPREDLEVSLGEDFRSCPNDQVTLSAQTLETDVSYTWFLNGDLIAGETTSSLDINVPETVGSLLYAVEITMGDCSGTANVSILPFSVGNCTVSEGLSPNGDGMNDCLDLEFLAARAGSFSMEVFNRYGMSMFSKNGYINSFCGLSTDGNELPTGTYYYVIKFDTPDQEYGELKTGWVYINRDSN